MADAQRIATLAVTQGGRYLDDLWTLVDYALDERVRRFAYAQVTRPSSGEEWKWACAGPRAPLTCTSLEPK